MEERDGGEDLSWIIPANLPRARTWDSPHRTCQCRRCRQSFPRMMIKRNFVALLTTAMLSLTALSCRETKTPVPPPSQTGAKTNPQVYQVKGVIKELFPERKKVKIAHEEITNYMEAMTMM